MNRVLFLLVAGLLSVGAGTAFSDQDFEQALRLVRRGSPEVAAVRLRTMLEDENRLDELDRESIVYGLVEAYLRSGQIEKAVELLGEVDEPIVKEPSAEQAEKYFWLGQVHAARGQWEKTAELFAAVIAQGEIYPQESVLSLAEAHQQLGEVRAALELLAKARETDAEEPRFLIAYVELLLQSGELEEALRLQESSQDFAALPGPLADYLRASISFAQGHHQQALEAFTGVLEEPTGRSARIWAGATLGLSRCHRQLGDAQSAQAVLEQFIASRPQSTQLPAMFSELDELFTINPELSRTVLFNWTRDQSGQRRWLADYYLARAEHRAGRFQEATDRLEAMAAALPEWESIRWVWIELARVLQAQGRPGQSLGPLSIVRRMGGEADTTSAFAQLLAGIAEYRLERWDAAEESFLAAVQADPSLEELALFNRALATLRRAKEGGGDDAFLAAYSEFSQRFPESPKRSELVLERGLHQAASLQDDASATLAVFLRDFPNHQRQGEAAVALAELAFLRPVQTDGEVEHWMAQAREHQLPSHLRAQLDLLQIWVTASRGEREEALQAAIALLNASEQAREHEMEPHPLEDALRLKAGEILLHQEDYPAARSHFEIAARIASAPEMREKALFLAGHAAMRSLDAEALDLGLEFFEDVVRGGGEFTIEARLAQAEIKETLGNFGEATALYEDVILRLEENSPTTRRARLARGRSLYATGENDAEAYRQAYQSFQEVAEDEEASALEQLEAQYLSGRCLERLAEFEQAMEVYHAVLDRGLPEEPGYIPEQQLVWIYKAGFDLARLLQRQEAWTSAVAVYERMVEVEGPRAQEAEQLVNQLRLRHFIWEDEF
ncbi:MAG: tetratricopeptide repeat protein [Verrucomicrobiales bacterium]